MRRTVAQLLRTLDGWLPVRRMRMTWAVAAACAGYMALIALQFTLVAPPYQRAAAAAAPAHRGLLSISKESGVCLLPFCLLAPTCVAGVGGTCLLPLATPAPSPPVQPAPPAPAGAAPVPAAPPHSHAVAAVPAPVSHPARHVAVVQAAPQPEAPPVALAVTPVDRPVPAVAAPSAPLPVTGVPLPAPPAVALPATAAPSPPGSPWWLYALFVGVDGAAAAALIVLLRRTAAAQTRG